MRQSVLFCGVMVDLGTRPRVRKTIICPECTSELVIRRRGKEYYLEEVEVEKYEEEKREEKPKERKTKEK